MVNWPTLDGDGRHPLDAGEIPGVDQVGPRRRLFQLLASLVDGASRMAERRKCLQYPNALDVVDHDPVQPPQFLAGAHEGLVGGFSKCRQDEQNQQQGREGHQCELPVDDQHQGADQEGDRGGADQLDAGVRGEEFDGLDVADDLGRDRAGLLPGMKPHRQ
jgi:hypothetical protein